MLNNRYEFVLLFDVNKGNPNGDPDSANQPRTDFETGKGLVTDVSIKRKIRNYISTQKQDQPPFKIYVKEKGILVNEQKKAYIDQNLQQGDDEGSLIERARKWMCENFFDVRAFGAVMTTGKVSEKDKKEFKEYLEKNKEVSQWNCGQVRGPVQLGFAESIDPVEPMNITITRVALTNADDTKRGAKIVEEGGDTETASSSQFGNKYIIPYGLYKLHGFISPSLCKNTGFSKDDLKLLFDALEKMFDFDRSASRGEMATRKLIIFEHNSALGEAAAHKLFDKIKIAKKDADVPPREFGHYEIWFGKEDEKGKPIVEDDDITKALKSETTIVTIAVKDGENLKLNTSPEWNK